MQYVAASSECIYVALKYTSRIRMNWLHEVLEKSEWKTETRKFTILNWRDADTITIEQELQCI